MKSKKLSENILKLIKSEGFRYINLDTVIETNHILKDLVSHLDVSFFLLMIRRVMKFVLDQT